MKMIMKPALMATLLLALVGAGTAQAQIAVDVDINVGSITILSSFTDINVTIDDTALAALFAPMGCTSGTPAENCDEGAFVGTAMENSGALSVDGGISPTALLGNINAVNLTLQNVWAVRAIGGTTVNTTVAATITGATTLTGPNGSSIGVSSISAPGGTFADPGLGNPHSGDVVMTLDLANTSSDGLHGGTEGATYMIEVTGT